MVNCKNKQGQTPLHLCAKENRFILVPIMIEHGAEVDLTDAKGKR
jgi:ankyrin repeat protein